MKSVFVLLACIFLVQICAKPKKTQEDEFNEHVGGEDNEHHNPDYDHEQFVGKDEAPTYDELSPEESKAKLGKLFDKVDKDQNGTVTEVEMIDWIKFTQKRYVVDDAAKQMKQNDVNRDGMIEFEEYKNSTYGHMDDEDPEGDSFKDMVARDERRFGKADKDGDTKLNETEYTAFLHPENDDDMKGVVVNETLEDIDKDKDGFISAEEYIGDLWPEEEKNSGAEEPDWVKTERDQFVNYRDQNKDGKMDMSEVADWIMPNDFDHISSEAKHLVQESDVDGDGMISKTEMLDKVDLFVGSQATDFGEALKRAGDEL